MLDLAGLGRTAVYVLLAAVAFGEALPLVGWLLPGGILVGAAAALAVHGHLSLGAIAVVTLAGSLAGDGLMLAVGRRSAAGLEARFPRLNALLHGRRTSLLRRQMAVRPAWTAFVARFQYPVRSLTPLLGGTARVPRVAFLLGNAAAAVLCVGSLVVGGALVGLGYDAASRALGWGLGILALVILGLYVWGMVRSARRAEAAA